MNATLRRRMKDGWEGYAGAAFSYNRQGIRGAAQTDDCWEERQQELHVKATATRLWTSGLRIGGGVESFIRRYANRYAWREVESACKVRPVVSRLPLRHVVSVGAVENGSFFAGGAYRAGQTDEPLAPRGGELLCGRCHPLGHRGALHPAGGVPSLGSPSRLGVLHVLAIQPGHAVRTGRTPWQGGGVL